MNRIGVLETLKIPYIIRKGNYKRITIGYYHQNLLTIKCPTFITDEFLESFIKKNINWIIKHQPLDIGTVKYENGASYLFLGKTYIINIFKSHHESVNIIGDKLIIYSNDIDTTVVKKLLDKWRMEQAELVFNEVLHKCFIEMNKYLDKFPTLIIRKYKSRWGCCYPKRNQIIINISVVNLPLNLIEYVFFHELSHFIHLNHSPQFHAFLMKFVPNEKKIMKEIKKYNPFYE